MVQQVWYFISKNQPGLWCSDPLKSSPGSHSLLVSDSVGTTVAARFWRFCSRSALRRLIYIAASQYPSRTRNYGRLLTVATQSSLAEVDKSKVAWQQCMWCNYCAHDKCRCTNICIYIYLQTRETQSNLRTVICMVMRLISFYSLLPGMSLSPT